MSPALDLTWLLIGLPLAFALGWLASRLDLRQLRRTQQDAPRATFKGLSLLLNEQHDKAIDAFIEAVQQDPDTTELHFALGNLFRRRGEFERALRVHEHLLGRADLSRDDRVRAQQALAQDFTGAGLFDRAEAAWQALMGSRFDAEARLALLSLHERSQEWSKAMDQARELEAAGHGSFTTRITHYACELAERAQAQGRRDEADAALAAALASPEPPPRALVLAGEMAIKRGDNTGALAHWERLRTLHPTRFVLVARAYAAAAQGCGQPEAARAALEASLQTLPAVELLEALLDLQVSPPPGDPPLQARLVDHLNRYPTLSGALLLLAQPWPQEHDTSSGPSLDPAPVQTEVIRLALKAALLRSAKPLLRYRCAACGFESQRHFWQCPGCLTWDSFPPQRLDAQ